MHGVEMAEADAAPAFAEQDRAGNFARVAAAIRYVAAHFEEQPSLAMVAGVAGLSPFYFQRVFRRLAGVSPKKFLQYVSVRHARTLLAAEGATLLEAAHATGFSGPGRLHDLFIRIEAMTPGEYKQGGAGLVIAYSHAETLFGRLTVASTGKGICYAAFADDDGAALAELARRFPRAALRCEQTAAHRTVLRVFDVGSNGLEEITLHLRGTPFEIKVWESLLRIPSGRVASYGDVARAVGRPAATRAVGTAVGRNAVAFLIPCHRVIRSDGALGGYRWGGARKAAMLGWELAAHDCPQAHDDV
jgi:AraC family transcriptional regulator of adaptative response/methylated-DNA-[protein]-cysteine methyltransferase